MAAQLKCPRCQAMIAPGPPDADHVQCPACGGRFRIRRAGPNPAISTGTPTQTKPSRPDDDYRLASTETPNRATPGFANPMAASAVRRNETKKQPASSAVDPRIVIGAGVGGGLLLLVLVIGVVAFLWNGDDAGRSSGSDSNSPADKLSATAVVIDTPLPGVVTNPTGDLSDDRPQPPEGPPVVWTAAAILPPVEAEAVVGGATRGEWEGEPDPPTEEAAPLPADVIFHFATGPLFASRGGPFAIEVPAQDRSGLSPPDDPLGEPDHSKNLGAFPVQDLRTGKAVGRFAWNAPLWRPARLSPDGMYLVPAQRQRN